MRSTLGVLSNELDELKSLVASIAPVNSALKEHANSVVRKYVLIRRRFDYAAFVVALYASFEKFLEDLVAAYAGLAARRFQYAELPPKLVKKHLSRTAEILSRGRIGEGRYEGLREYDVVKNLFECLSGAMPYTLNDAAITAHDLNLRAEEINNLFGSLGIDHICDRARRADAFVEWYRTTIGADGSSQITVPATTIEGRLKEIVDRRNRVAHRGGYPDSLLGTDDMTDAINFVEAFSRSIFAITVGHYLQDRYVLAGQIVLLQQRKGDGPFKHGTVVVVDKPEQRLFVGQPLFLISEDVCARWGRIQSIMIDDIQVKSVESATIITNGIGIALDFKCPEGASLAALEVDDDAIWS